MLAGTASLIWFAWTEILPLLDGQSFNWENILMRFLISSPVIYLTLFFARQYNLALMIGEDYAFKTASSIAFLGYRRELQNDPEGARLLTTRLITNINANPMRLILKNNDANLMKLIKKLIKKLNTNIGSSS